jgi:hypothetical protein
MFDALTDKLTEYSDYLTEINTMIENGIQSIANAMGKLRK